MASSTATTSSNAHDNQSALRGKVGLPIRENATLLGLVLVLSVAYIAQHSIRRRISEKRAFERKRRLLGIATPGSSNSSPSSHNHVGNITNTEGKDVARSSRAISSVSNYAWTFSHLIHLDTCFQYLQELSPTPVKRFFSQRTRRRKDQSTSNGVSSLSTSTSAKPTRGRAGTIEKDSRSSSSTSSSPSQPSHKSTLNIPNHTPFSPHSPAGRQSARTTQTRQASSNANASSSSSRSRSATQSSKQQLQRAANLVPTPSSPRASQPVMKSIGTQVTVNDLSESSFHVQSELALQQPTRRQGKGKKSRSTANSNTASPDLSMVVSSTITEHKTDLETACCIPLPTDDETFEASSDMSRNLGSDADNTLSRNVTVTNRSSRIPSNSVSSIRKSNSNAKRTPGYVPPNRSDTKESLQSPTDSSSGRSASLSVSTDATGMTSLRSDQELHSSPSAREGKKPVRRHFPPAPLQAQDTLQSALSLQFTAPASPRDETVQPSLQKSPSRPKMLSYSFHTGFQEPSSVGQGEIDEDSGPMTSPPQHSRRQNPLLNPNAVTASDVEMYLPSPPDSQRKIRIDALGYPSIPLPPSISSASSSAHNSPSSARRATSAPRPSDSPPSSTLPQSPVNERKPSNAQIHASLQSGMYPVSLGVQSPSSYGHLPTSPPSHAGMQQQHQQQASPLGIFGHTSRINGPSLASPQLQPGMGLHQQQQQVQQYINQAHYQYQHLLQQQQAITTTNGHAHVSANLPHGYMQSNHPSPSYPLQPSPGFLNPHMHRQNVQGGAGGNSSSGGSNRSSVHLASHSQLSSRSASPQNSLAASFSTERDSSTGTSTAPTEGDNTAQSHFAQQQQQHMHGTGQNQINSQNQMDLVHKMTLMQAQIQFAMQQNEAQNQQAQAQAHAHAAQHLFQSAAGSSMPSTSVPHASLGPGLPSPFLVADGQQQNYSPFLLNGFASPLASGAYPYQVVTSGHSPSIASPYQQYVPQHQPYTQHAAGPSTSNSTTSDHVASFPTVRRRQSTPALGADAAPASFSASQGPSSGAPYTTGKKRNRRNSRPYRMSSYGQVLDSPDYHAAAYNDSSAQYDPEVDMSTASSSYIPSSRPTYDRRRSSLIPPPSPLLNTRKERRSRHKEKEREKLRQMEMDDEEVTNNENDIKADLELLAQMQEEEDKDPEMFFSQDDVSKRLKSMETVLERRGKELEIARWKLKCVEVDRRGIEAEHQKALTHFYERAERAEARLRLVDNGNVQQERTNEKGSLKASSKELHDTPSLQGDGSVPSEASQADSDSVAPSLSIPFSSTTPHLAYSADYCSPTDFNSASYRFSESPYISSKYPPHPCAADYKSTRRGRRSPRATSFKYRQMDEIGNSTLSPRNKQFPSLTPSDGSKSASGHEDTASSENSDSDEDVEILLDSSYSRSPSVHPSVPHSRVPSGGLLENPAAVSAAMTENKTVGLGIESSSSSSDGSKPLDRAPVDFVGSLPSFTISQPPASPSSTTTTEKG